MRFDEDPSRSDPRPPAERPDRPARVWYGLCTYWTEDWTTLISPGIPRCPVCGSPGFEMPKPEWDAGVVAFEARGNPGYAAFLDEFRETCRGRGVTILDVWNAR